jgi:predicted metal-dependent hydrolase
MPALKLPFETGHIFVNEMPIGFSVVRSRRRKRTISFMLGDDLQLRVLAPNRVGLSTIHRLLQRRAPWITRKLGERQRQQSTNQAPVFTQDGCVAYLGHACRIEITRNGVARGCQIGFRRFTVNLPDVALSDDELRQEVRLEILLALKKRAKKLFRKRMDVWAPRLGVSYKDVRVVDPQRQWGSCNVQNVIRMNWRLIMAPLSLLDYVVAHELCHVQHKNHGPRFWRQVASVMPDYPTRRKQLRLIGASLKF